MLHPGPSALASILLGASLVGCASPRATEPPPARGAIRATDAEPTYLADESTDSSLLAAIRSGIELGRERFGTYGPLRVYVMDGRAEGRELVEDFCARSFRPGDGVPEDQFVRHCVETFELPEDDTQIYSSIHHHAAEPLGAIVFLNVEPPGDDPRRADEIRATAVHEYVHVYQAAFQEPGGPDPANPGEQIPGPAWLTEGPATYMAIEVLGSDDWREAAHEQARAALRGAMEGRGLYLDDGETYDGPGEPELVDAVLYQGGAAAAKWLIDTRSADAFWIDYYTSVPEVGWEAAFERAFGLDLEAFYAAFRRELMR